MVSSILDATTPNCTSKKLLVSTLNDAVLQLAPVSWASRAPIELTIHDFLDVKHASPGERKRVDRLLHQVGTILN